MPADAGMAPVHLSVANGPARLHSALGTLRIMKTIAAFLILASCQLCFAAGDTNIIATGEWSKPVSLQNDQASIRGRLLIVRGAEPAYGGPLTTNWAMTFVELQNVTGACCQGVDVYFAMTDLHCELSDATGKAVPEPAGGGSGGRGTLGPYWVNLPYNSTIRLYIESGSEDPLSLYHTSEPWGSHYWSIRRKGTNTYYWGGILSVSTHTNSSLPDFSTLVFPRTRIATGEVEQAR